MWRQQLTVFITILLLVACTNQSKEELLQSGIELLDSGNVRGSIVYLKNALEKDPNYYEARYHLADAYLRSGRLERAESEFTKVSLQSSSFTDLPLKLAEIYLFTSRNELAFEILEKFHHDTAPTSESLDIKGRAYALTGDYEKADQLLQKAMALDPENPDPKIHLAKSFLKQSRDEDAYQLLLLCVEQHQEFAPGYELLARLELKRRRPSQAKNNYRYLYELDPMNVNALYMQGFISLMSGQLEEAIPFAAKLTAEFPADYRSKLLRGLIAYRQEDFDNALIDLIAAIKINQNPLGNYFLGLSYFRLGSFELAVNQFQKVLDVKPDLSQARLMLATIFLRQKRIDDCIREVRYVIVNDDRNGLAYNILGSAQLSRQDFDAAMQSFDRAIEIDPKSADIYLKKSRAHITVGETEIAEAALQEALALSPDTLNARLMLATLYVRQENYVEAVESLQAGLSGVPADALVYNFLANISFKQKDEQAVVKNLTKAKLADPGYISPVLTLASYYLAKADYNRAISEYHEALERENSNFKALVGLGLAYELSGRADSAQPFYTKLLETGGPEATLYLAQLYASRKRPKEALSLIDDALKRSPSHLPLYELKTTILLSAGHTGEALATLKLLEEQATGRGYPRMIGILLKNGQSNQAEKIAERVINDNPGLSYGYILKSTIYEYRRQYDKAAEIILDGLSMSQKKSGLNLKLGQIHALNGNSTEAIKLYQNIINSNSDYYPAAFALGALYDHLGNKKEAQHYYQKTISLNDRHVLALNNLAYLYADNYGDMGLALRMSLRAYRLAPGQQDVMDTLGYVFLKNGKVDEAVKILEKANKLNSYNPLISYHLALAYVESRQLDKAITELEKTLEVDNFPEADSCRQLLAKLKT